MIKQGAIAWLDLDPQSGHEQKGRRPVVVISNREFHLITGNKLAMVCPITNTSRAKLLHIELNRQTKTTGFVMCEQAKVLDIASRNYEFKEIIPYEILIKILNRVQAISLLDPL
ncbi:MAG: type II toxin-antitoxin system PemK/MazF family toxin [Defluviitaleaceae bacterium]|nr:type II toxin-antitoxin system PemK/MazF family toxin [Defluviitaleaceae bacterium]